MLPSAVRRDDEVRGASLYRFHRAESPTAFADALTGLGDIAGPVANEWHTPCIEMGYGYLPILSRLDFLTVLEILDDVIGIDDVIDAIPAEIADVSSLAASISI